MKNIQNYEPKRLKTTALIACTLYPKHNLPLLLLSLNILKQLNLSYQRFAKSICNRKFLCYSYRKTFC